MEYSNIFILGAGGIGSIYGAFLSKKNDVTLIGSKAHVDAVNSKGLSISGDVNEDFRLKSDTEIHEIPERTLIILTTKAYDSAYAVRKIADLLRKDTIILILQNGLGNEELVKSVAGNETVILRGITAVAAEFLEPGTIRFWNGETIIEQNATSEKIANIFNACGLKTTLTNNITMETWNKVVVNCVVNPLTTLFHVRNYEIASDSLEPTRRQIVEECTKVGNAEGIVFEPNLAERIDSEILNYTNFSSMYQDIIKGKKTEIDFLNGKIVDLGRKNDILTPVNETLVNFIKFMEEKNELSGSN